MARVEFVRFRVLPTDVEPLLAARSAASEALQRIAGFRGAYLVSLEEHEWLDVTIWDHDESEGAPPAIEMVAAYTDLMTEVLGEEAGVLVEPSPPSG
jgi:hypothetical protein